MVRQGYKLLLLCWVLILNQAVLANSNSTQTQLFRSLKAKSYKVRLQAVIQIGKKRIKKAVGRLRKMVDNSREKDSVRAAGMIALAQLGDKASRKRFAYLLGHRKVLLSKSAQKALILIDQAHQPPAVYLVQAKKTQAAKGISPKFSKGVDASVQKRIQSTAGLVEEAGEREYLSDAQLEKHLRARNLEGLVLRPKLLILREERTLGKTILFCQIRVELFSMLPYQKEFSAMGEADAWIEGKTISGAQRRELQSEVLQGAADSAVLQALQYLQERSY